MKKLKFFSKIALTGSVICAFLAPQVVQARDVQVNGPVEAVVVGATATFMVADQQLGDQCDVALGFCAADFTVSYDKTVFEFVRTDYAGPVVLDPLLDLFTAPGLGDADPAGSFNVQLVLTSAIPGGPGDIFSVTLKAIGASAAGGSQLSVAPLADAPSYVFQTASATVTVVPEPSTVWMMSAALFAGFMLLRRQR